MKLSAFLNFFSIIGIIAFTIFASGAFHLFFLSKPALDAELVTLNATLLRVEIERNLRGDSALVMTLQGSNVRLRSDNPYPSKFKYGSRTPEILKEGERVTFILNKRETERLPRNHRSRGYLWREFVGMSTPSAVHLTPEDYEQWYLKNQKVGKFVCLILSSLGIFLIIAGYKAKRRTFPSQKHGATNGIRTRDPKIHNLVL